MIIVYVRHYLNDDGLTYFETTWFPNVDMLKWKQVSSKIQPH